MRYLLLIYSDPENGIGPTDPGWGELMDEYAGLNQRMTTAGVRLLGHRLDEAATAASLRRDGEAIAVIDGPYIETREQLGGFYILECDEEQALELVAAIPTARTGAVEVRQLAGMDSRILDAASANGYVALIYGDEAKFAPQGSPEQLAIAAGHQRFTEEAIAAGRYVAADALYPSASGRTVRVRDGTTLITDGPFAETREQLGGFYVLSCPDQEAAVASARGLVSANGGIEIRHLAE